MKRNFVKTLVGIMGVFIMAMVMFSFSNSGVGKPWDIPAKYKKMSNPVKSSDASVKVGKTLYSKHCASCHGKSGMGDGKKASELDTEMPDITTKAYKSQAAGVKYYQSFIGRDDMPNFEKKIPDDEDRWAIINYIETF